MARESAAFVFASFCEAYGTISIGSSLKTEQLRLSYIFKINVYLNCLYSGIVFYLPSFQVVSCLQADPGFSNRTKSSGYVKWLELVTLLSQAPSVCLI